jgi:glycosyltransferase involved in cell wall biosynthesis
MKILVISPYLPHPLAGHGGGVYLYDMLKHLSSEHTVTLISFADERESGLAKDLQSLPLSIHLISRRKGPARSIPGLLALVVTRALQFARSIILWEPYYVSKFRDRRMARKIRQVTAAEPQDIVQIEFTQMGSYVNDVRSGRTVIHEIDVVHRTMHRYFKEARSLPRKALIRLEWCRWNRYEPAMVRRFDGASTLTQPDLLLLQRMTGRQDVALLSPGVDTAIPRHTPQARNPGALLFVGNLAQIPNDDAAIWLCTEIFPRVVAAHPGATLSIIGRHASPALRSAASDGRITLRDFVEDLSPYFFQAGIYIAPLRLGGGIKIKILEALAHGIPVVTTPVGAEGITGLTSASARIARTAEGVARHCIELLRDPARAAAIGDRGRQVVRANFSWDAILQRTNAYYQSLLSP